jgi:hypothetical protein
VKKHLLQITAKGKQAASDQGWKGASGAAVFVDEQIVAVLVVKIVNGMVDFHPTRLEAALADADFSRRVSAFCSGAGRPQLPEPTLDLNRLVCLVNRDTQDAAFRTAFRPLLSGHPTQPLCCMIYGEARHHPAELVARFASVTIPELRKQRSREPLRFWPISWPKGDLDVLANLATLRALLWNHLSDQDGTEPPDAPCEFNKRLCDESRPHLFCTELSPVQLTVEGTALWGAWLAFLDSVSTCGLTRPPLHVFLVNNVNRAQVEAWLKQVPPTKQTKHRPLDELDVCDWLDFNDWIDRRIPRIVPSLAIATARLKDDLEQELERIVGQPAPPFTVSDLKEAVRNIAKRRN